MLGIGNAHVLFSTLRLPQPARGRIIDRAIQVHGALGYSNDTPLAHMAQQARWARLADGADEIHQMRIAQRTIEAWERDAKLDAALGNLPL